ncbi:10 kDa heat shock protein, mitochondrial [Smittium mucronatum]|uniref:10 kDa heat shock protein, mitochondrial n=1 Tax=Smittium mucronatum TaxID=133383 RepID=A0A1R0GYU3_9FUNG|nr:10 kDa heat shock protein, mitochondrial [Smittium mucronatum]
MISSRALFSARKVVPLFDRVLIQRVKAEARTASGILLPEKAIEKLPEGIVLAVGPGKVGKDGVVVPLSLKEGDRVLLPSYGGNVVKVGADNDSEHILLHENEVLAKLE